MGGGRIFPSRVIVNHDPDFALFRAGLPADLQLPEQQGTSPAHSVSRGEALGHPRPHFYFYFFTETASGF
jgi:hypothetical protein